MQLGATPWHLWGQVVQNNYPAAGGVGATIIAPQQVANVNYNRPETWSFLMGFGIQSAPGSAFGGDAILQMDMLIGLGRSNIKIDGFFRQRFTAAQLNSNAYVFRWATRAQSFDSDVATAGATSPQPNFVEWFPAQSIQCQFRTELLYSGSLTITALAFFSPLHHHRPEWHLAKSGVPTPKFQGELGGY